MSLSSPGLTGVPISAAPSSSRFPNGTSSTSRNPRSMVARAQTTARESLRDPLNEGASATIYHWTSRVSSEGTRRHSHPAVPSVGPDRNGPHDSPSVPCLRRHSDQAEAVADSSRRRSSSEPGQRRVRRGSTAVSRSAVCECVRKKPSLARAAVQCYSGTVSRMRSRSRQHRVFASLRG